jgi:hypothetical protein
MVSKLADPCLRTYDAEVERVTKEAAKLAARSARLRDDAEAIATDRLRIEESLIRLDRVYYEPQCHLPGCCCNGSDGEVPHV